MDLYDATLLLFGLAALGAALLPRVLADRPLSLPIIYLAVGFTLFSLPTGIDFPNPGEYPEQTERLAELAVVVSLMAAGLQLDRGPGLREWAPTWRLLAVTMPLTIAGVALGAYWLVGLSPAAALLLGAVLSPTDPVLASDVQTGPPGDGGDSTRVTLTSEAGLNDGLAFPFTNAAIAAAGAATLGDWFGHWALDELVARTVIGAVAGVVLGRGLAWLAFRLEVSGPVAETAEGFVVLAATLIVYGATELAHGYGFLAVFVAGLAIRSYERDHEFHGAMHEFADVAERLLSAGLLILLGGAIADGLLGPLGWQGAAVGLGLVLVLRPLTGWVALIGTDLPTYHRAAIAFFGIRGIGTIFYLAHALNEASFEQGDELWAIVGFALAISVVVHGVTATPWMTRVGSAAEQAAERAA